MGKTKDESGMVEVIATSEGFDGVQTRKVGDRFFVHESVFKGIDAGNKRRAREHEAKMKNPMPGVELPSEPAVENPWFERYVPGREKGADLV